MSTDRMRRALAGVAGGAGAYVGGYVLTFLLVRGEVGRQFGADLPAWKGAAWYHLNAHFVDLVSSRSVGPFEGATTLNLIAESSGTTATLLYAVPPLALLIAGGAVALATAAPDAREAALGGVATVVGYGALATLAALASPHTVSGSFIGVEISATIAPEASSAVIVAGLLYPAVLGTAGAVLAQVVFGR